MTFGLARERFRKARSCLKRSFNGTRQKAGHLHLLLVLLEAGGPIVVRSPSVDGATPQDSRTFYRQGAVVAWFSFIFEKLPLNAGCGGILPLYIPLLVFVCFGMRHGNAVS